MLRLVGMNATRNPESTDKIVTTPNTRWYNATKGGVLGVGVSATVVGLTLPVLLFTGFGPAGIIAGSWAAGVQGSAVMAGGLFASCQSIATSGIALSTATGIVATSGFVGGVVGKVIDNI
jgi:hypothetical protein